MKTFRPMLACDADENRIQFPVIVQPKIDGVRALNVDGCLTGRSLKAFANRFVSEQFSQLAYAGLDGELYLSDSTDPDLCRKTTAALTTKAGQPALHWVIFDCIGDGDYQSRLAQVKQRVAQLNNPAISVIPSQLCHSHAQLLDIERDYLDQGYEGVIVRTLHGVYKNGRVTQSAPHLTRIKRFVEEEAVVMSLNTAQENGNATQINELGLSYRSSHQAGKTEKQEIGSLVCRDLKTGDTITVSFGNMTREDREHYFHNPAQLLGKTIKYKHFPHGRKDKPRFPTFVCVRPAVDRDEPIEVVDLTPDDVDPRIDFAKLVNTLQHPTIQTECNYREGMRVNHTLLGDGVVLKAELERGKEKVRIDFGAKSIRWFAPALMCVRNVTLQILPAEPQAETLPPKAVTSLTKLFITIKSMPLLSQPILTTPTQGNCHV